MQDNDNSSRRPHEANDTDGRVRYDASLLDEREIRLFSDGSHCRLYEKLGAHPIRVGGSSGVQFAVWAPNAKRVSVIGDFNNWNHNSHPMRERGRTGVWEGFIPELGEGELYKYFIASIIEDHTVEKADPIARRTEVPPGTASIVSALTYAWADDDWMRRRPAENAIDAPISIYEMHLGSWMRVQEEDDRSLTYIELAAKLVEHIKRLGFTHVEFLPVMEHPFGGSWGYQTTSYFAPTARFGTPQDFMYLIDTLHQHGIGVVLDWAPFHFPSDEHGLGYFDGTYLYEYTDPQQRTYPEWNTLVFDYSRPEVRSFMLSSAFFWIDMYHADGIRVDAVASMLRLDYLRKEGEWTPNKLGGRENLEAIDFVRRFNREVHDSFPMVQTIAEDSTAWPMVTRPVTAGGLSFDLKWGLGWMHDTLEYMRQAPSRRRDHYDTLLLPFDYAFDESFVLCLSHDEVKPAMGSLLTKMPGEDQDKFANLRLLLAYMYAFPGKKLLFMGGEFGQWDEWSHDASLQWDLLQNASHLGLQRLVGDLNHLYRKEPALHELDCDRAGVSWPGPDSDRSSLVYLRNAKERGQQILVALNFAAEPRQSLRVGVSDGGVWEQILSTNSPRYQGDGEDEIDTVSAAPIPSHGQPYSLNLTLPPFSATFLKSTGLNQAGKLSTANHARG